MHVKEIYVIFIHLFDSGILLIIDLNKKKRKKGGPYLFLDTAATSTRKFTQKSEIFRHKTSHMVLSIIFLEDKHKILLHDDRFKTH
jgi:hypothetical protein